MNLSFDMKLAQEQKLIMTMEMQQSIKLLQMSSYELLKYIDKELQDNVVLDCEAAEQENLDYEIKDKQKEYKEIINYIEIDTYNSKNYFQGNDSEVVSPLNFISNKPTLKDYIMEQLRYSTIDRKTFNICTYIVDNIDSRGYIEEIVIEELTHSFKISNVEAETCLQIIQGFDPVGIAARNLEECLILQLRRLNINDSVLEDIISNYLHQLSQGKYKQIAARLNIEPKKVQEYEGVIKKLEPKPSRGFFTGDEIGYLVPDIYVNKIEDEYIVVGNENLLPRLFINKCYKQVIQDTRDENAVAYVKEKIDSAMFLIKSIENRKITLCIVMEEIIKIQRDYLDGKEKNLKPMTIKMVANRIDMHESTVSRAVRDKYVALHNGSIKRIKDFFTSSINSANEDLSATIVKDLIKAIIAEENELKPLSDAVICNKLKEKNIDISRRTVAKYREEIGIKSSTQRKKIV